mmetsp:Transcript_2634/g.10526  ORF Transcript_2634/g.10526 Transcript_2634/m.10526 type:complete len:198 (-) Transcript_2634:102-695(-)
MADVEASEPFGPPLASGEQQSEGQAAQQAKQSAHPRVLMAHVLFKGAALAFYLLGTLLFSSYVHAFVLVGLCMGADFWVTQNVSGRLLVGLRWWNEVAEDGSSVWRYDSLSDMGRVNSYDSTVFWWTLYLYPGAWIALSLMALFGLKFTWLLIAMLGVMLGAANTIGYTRCSREAKQRISNLAKETVVSGLQAAFKG